MNRAPSRAPLSSPSRSPAIARNDERACRDERRPINRLRADLPVTFPAPLAIAGEDLSTRRMLRLPEHWP